MLVIAIDLVVWNLNLQKRFNYTRHRKLLLFQTEFRESSHSNQVIMAAKVKCRHVAFI